MVLLMAGVFAGGGLAVVDWMDRRMPGVLRSAGSELTAARGRIPYDELRLPRPPFKLQMISCLVAAAEGEQRGVAGTMQLATDATVDELVAFYKNLNAPELESGLYHPDVAVVYRIGPHAVGLSRPQGDLPDGAQAEILVEWWSPTDPVDCTIDN